MSTEPLYLTGVVAGRRVAIGAAAIESVVDIDDIQPVPGAPAHVVGLAALRSRVLTVIDCAAALGLARTAIAGEPLPAIVAQLDGHLYGFVLDQIDDVVAAETPLVPAPAPLGGAWSAASTGIVELAEETMPVLDLARMLQPAAPAAAVNAALTPAR